MLHKQSLQQHAIVQLVFRSRVCSIGRWTSAAARPHGYIEWNSWVSETCCTVCRSAQRNARICCNQGSTGVRCTHFHQQGYRASFLSASADTRCEYFGTHLCAIHFCSVGGRTGKAPRVSSQSLRIVPFLWLTEKCAI